MEIAHISDLHICVRHKPRNTERAEKLIRLISERSTDHLIISGDISQNSHTEDFEVMRQILEKYDFLSPEKTSMVIGNHDIYGGVHLAEDIITFPTKCTNVNFQERVNRFTSFYSEIFYGTIRKSEDSYFPYVKVLDEFILIGLNSNAKYSKISNIAASNGKIESEDFEFLNDVLQQSEFRYKKKLLTLHHHVEENLEKFDNNLWNRFERYTMKLRGKKRLLKFLINNKIDLVLHGHVHQNYSYQQKGIHFLNGGASTENELDKDMRINFIELFNNKINITINSYQDTESSKNQLALDHPLVPSFA